MSVRASRPHAVGMTLIEVVASLLLLVVGGLAVLGLILYGITLSNQAQESATGMETARTILADPEPIGLKDRTVSGNTISGYLNGYFVRRTEESDPPVTATNNALQMVTVTAEVFRAGQGTKVAFLRERQVAACAP
jgi:hypothetical protein